jgi:hypothetical protein
MGVLRWIFVAACLSCIVVVAWNSRWEGSLTRTDHTIIVDLGRSPVWAPPAVPPYSRFSKDFKDSQGFPDEDDPGLSIRRELKSDWMAVDLLLYLWLVTVVGGLLYLGVRGDRRDVVLHCGLSVGIGLTIAASVCVGLWLLCGGWGAPAPEFFGGLGLVGGLLVGLGSLRTRRL